MYRNLLLFTINFLIVLSFSFAQNGKPLPNIPFGPSNSGKEYYFNFPANYEYGASIKYCRLYITAGVRTKVTIAIGSKNKKTIYTVPFDIVTYDLSCLLYTSDAADERSSVDLGGRRIIKKKNQQD